MHHMRSRSGYFTYELIFVLWACCMLMPVAFSCMKLLIPLTEFREDIQDEIALCQLRHILIASEDFSVSSQEVHFTYHEEENVLRFVNRHLILSPGTQIFLSDISGIAFNATGDILKVKYFRDDRETERVLVHV